MKGFWSTTFDDHAKAWVLEWRVPERLRRVVHLVIDVSDSMTRYRLEMRDFLGVVGEHLEVGDRCVLWVAGATRSRDDIRISHSSDRARLKQVFDSIPEGDDGTWMSETARAVAAVAQGDENERLTRQVQIIVSDGEVFDAEAIEEGSFGLFRLGSGEHDRLSDRTVPISRESLPGFLACPALRVEVSLSPEDVEAWWVSAAGEVEESVRMPVASRDGLFRLAFAADVEPLVFINYVAGGESWSEPVPGSLPMPDGGPFTGIRPSRSRDDFRLDDQQLSVLVALARAGYPRSGRDFTCPHCPREVDANLTLVCPACQRSLIAKGMPRVPPGYWHLRQVEVLPGGRFGENVEATRTPTRKTFDLQHDQETGRTYLVLSLGA